MAILAVLALSPSVAFAHSPISSPALKLSVAKLASAAVDRIERRVEGDDENAGLARLLDRRHDRGRVARHQQDALGAGGHQLLDRRDLAVVVAVELAGVGLRREAELLGLGLEALLHLDEERIGVGLGDEADDRSVGVSRRAGQRERERRGGGGRKNSRNLGHCLPPYAGRCGGARRRPQPQDASCASSCCHPSRVVVMPLGQTFGSRVKIIISDLNYS